MKTTHEHIGVNHFSTSPKSSKGMGWIVSYADLMTIILTFMILLLSISTIAQTKYDLMVQSLTGRKVGNLQEVKTKIDQVIQTEALNGEVKTNIDDRGLTIEFSNSLLFLSGDAALTEKASEVFAPIGKHLVQDLENVYGLIIEGYTDDIPISNTIYQSNWELSTSRAIHVMERLHKAGLASNRMSVQGFSDTRSATDVDLHDEEAVAKLSTDELKKARSANRRVVIRIDKLHEEILKKIVKSDTQLEMRSDKKNIEKNIAPRNIPGFGLTTKGKNSEK